MSARQPTQPRSQPLGKGVRFSHEALGWSGDQCSRWNPAAAPQEVALRETPVLEHEP